MVHSMTTSEGWIRQWNTVIDHCLVCKFIGDPIACSAAKRYVEYVVKPKGDWAMFANMQEHEVYKQIGYPWDK